MEHIELNRTYTLDKLIDKLTKIRNSTNGNVPVFVEVNGQQSKNGNYNFDVEHHYHEKSVYDGVEYPEINEVIIMPVPNRI
jgi:hypothetical protein